MQLFRCSLQHAVIFLSRINAIVPMQSATRSNISVAPLSSNSSSSLFYSTPLINHLSLPTNSNSSASSGSNVHHLSNGKSSKHHGGYCNYSEYNTMDSSVNINSYFYAVNIELHFLHNTLGCESKLNC